jgi:hypothetical protein
MSTQKTAECVFVTVPFTDTPKPLMAPAILSSIAKQAGKTSATIDLNQKFLRYLDQVTESDRFKLLAFFREEHWHKEISVPAEQLIHDMAQEILSYQPAIVGISVFTYNCRCATKYLAWMLKRQQPSIKIVIGGAGIMKSFSGAPTFAEELLKNKVIDFYIYGDGEKALYHYLTTQNTQFAGINTQNWMTMNRQEVELLPRPDYSDYEFDLYQQPLSLPILGSRGCVRQCTFCDYHTHWDKFTYRSGQHIFDEMIEFHQRYEVTYFHFTDSLVNGNLREYRALTQLLSDYNKDLPEEKQITWGGFFIFRNREAFTERDWQLTVTGGGRHLAVGIETLNDAVRKELGKNFTNEDIEFSLQMARRHGAGKIKFQFLFFTGYPSETDADYEYQAQWWRDHKDYGDVIWAANTGTPLGILDNTPLKENFDKLGLIQVGPEPEDWVNPANGNTPEKRVAWNKMMVDVIRECGIQNVTGYDTHYILERMRSQL